MVTIFIVMPPERQPLLIPSTPRCDRGRLVGADPRRLAPGQASAAGLTERSPMKAIRAYCLVCAGRPAEVRKCVAIHCPLWLLRMGRWPGRRRRAAERAAVP
jgi:hypothetical protein